jgi:hypothetical protein
MPVNEFCSSGDAILGADLPAKLCRSLLHLLIAGYKRDCIGQ